MPWVLGDGEGTTVGRGDTGSGASSRLPAPALEGEGRQDRGRRGQGELCTTPQLKTEPWRALSEGNRLGPGDHLRMEVVY